MFLKRNNSTHRVIWSQMDRTYLYLFLLSEKGSRRLVHTGSSRAATLFCFLGARGRSFERRLVWHYWHFLIQFPKNCVYLYQWNASVPSLWLLLLLLLFCGPDVKWLCNWTNTSSRQLQGTKIWRKYVYVLSSKYFLHKTPLCRTSLGHDA